MLLCSENVNQDNLLSYAREAADFATNYQLPSLDFAINHNGQPDVAMFDFTSMYASENAALMRERQAHQLLVALVGDSLLEVLLARRAFVCAIIQNHGSLLRLVALPPTSQGRAGSQKRGRPLPSPRWTGSQPFWLYFEICQLTCRGNLFSHLQHLLGCI